MTEPAVTLTDYAVAIECALFAALLARQRAIHRDRQSWFLVFFAAVGAASIFGGTVHGYYPDPQSPGWIILWPATLLAVGATALAAWVIGAGLLWSPSITRRVTIAAATQFALYGVIVLCGSKGFRIAILNYLPAAFFLIAALAILYRRGKSAGAGWTAAGFAMTLVAGLMQQLKVAVHPVHFNHNAFAHVVQAIAVLLIFVGSRGLIGIHPNKAGDASC